MIYLFVDSKKVLMEKERDFIHEEDGDADTSISDSIEREKEDEPEMTRIACAKVCNDFNF